jgi:hypothetical protein
VIPLKKLNATIDRLSKPPRRVFKNDSSSDSETEVTRADPAVIDRLVEDSLRKSHREYPDENPYRPELNENSRRIAEHSPRRCDDLFEHSIQFCQERRDWRRKVKQYYAERELSEVAVRPRTSHKSPKFERVEVAGSREHVERMNASQKKSCVDEQEFSTPSRRNWTPRMSPVTPPSSRQVEDILAEVNAQLSRHS